MIVDSTGLHPAPSKLEVIARMPRPQTVKGVRTLQGLTGYLRQFVPNYSLTAAPLTDILRATKAWRLNAHARISLPERLKMSKRFSRCVQL